MLISEYEVNLAEKARLTVKNYRRNIAEGRKVAAWVTQLLSDIDKHPDTSFVSVGCLLQDKGVLS